MNKSENGSKYLILNALLALLALPFIFVFIFALYIGYVKFMKYVDREYDRLEVLALEDFKNENDGISIIDMYKIKRAISVVISKTSVRDSAGETSNIIYDNMKKNGTLSLCKDIENEVKPECENQIGEEIKLFLNNHKKPEPKPDAPEEMAKRILSNIK
ncbi:hypothetical protein [Campylobacter concisus]|uniref:Uncharacterized protein n=1 Tax=Campylobacter concisus TaxID=199 RepID=A0A2R4P2W6_9BACT|nr:hypothetical protein [Campylobacter concisus]AVX45028.1 hypothetical protein CCS77_2022 [Campylobacter concisus]